MHRKCATIPVNRSIDPRLPVLPHETATQLIEKKEHFVVAPCICRQERRLAGQGCDRPLETCISFGDAGSYFVQAGIGRPVKRRTVLDLLETADRAGAGSATQQQPRSRMDLLLLWLLLRGSAHR